MGVVKSSNKFDEIGLIILKCLSEIRLNAGRSFLSNVLKGSRSKSIVQTKQIDNPYFGFLAEVTLDQIIDFIDQLIDEGHLELNSNISKFNYPILKLTNQGLDCINNNTEIILEKSEITNSQEKDYHQKLEDIKLEHPRAYEPWNDEEEKKLIQLFSESKTISEIAKLMGRQTGGIKSRLKKLGLIKE